jgi:hypothetical protein
MQGRVLVGVACLLLVGVVVAMAYAGVVPRIKVAPAAEPTVNLIGQVSGINASSPPKWEGCVCSLNLGQQNQANIVTRDPLVQAILMIGFTSQRNIVVIATKLPGPPTGASGWPGGEWYLVQHVATTVGQ